MTPGSGPSTEKLASVIRLPIEYCSPQVLEYLQTIGRFGFLMRFMGRSASIFPPCPLKTIGPSVYKDVRGLDRLLGPVVLSQWALKLEF